MTKKTIYQTWEEFHTVLNSAGMCLWAERKKLLVVYIVIGESD